MVGFSNCCCKEDPPDKPIFCINKQSTTGTLEDPFTPTPFYNFNLPPGDTCPDPGPSGQTWEGWLFWRENIRNYGNGAAEYPWKRQPTQGTFNGLRVRPPDTTVFPFSIFQFWRSTGIDGWGDRLLYSIDITKANYYTQIDINLDFQHAPLYNARAGIYSWQSAYVSPAFNFSGIFTGQRQYLAPGNMGPILTIFMRREGFDQWAGGVGPWAHYYYITDRTSPNNFIPPKVVTKLDDPRPLKRLGVLAECVNLDQAFTSAIPIIKYTVDIDNFVVYSNTYPLLENYGDQGPPNPIPWRRNGYCRCIFAGAISNSGNSGLSGYPYSGVFGEQTCCWEYNVEEYYYADNFKITEIPL